MKALAANGKKDVVTGNEVKAINWNQLAELGLMARINQEILHPLGLAVSRNPETGRSDHIFVSDDGVYEYSVGTKSQIPKLTNEQIEEKLLAMIGGSRTE
jgi:hypothetical protein